MYVVRKIDSMGEAILHMGSIAEVQRWAKFNGLVLGKPALYVPVYSIEHKDGSKLDAETLKRLQPEDSQELYDKREHEAREYIAGRPLPRKPSDFNSLYAGQAHATVIKWQAREQQKRVDRDINTVVDKLRGTEGQYTCDYPPYDVLKSKHYVTVLFGGRGFVCPIPEPSELGWVTSLSGISLINDRLLLSCSSMETFSCKEDVHMAIANFNHVNYGSGIQIQNHIVI